MSFRPRVFNHLLKLMFCKSASVSTIPGTFSPEDEDHTLNLLSSLDFLYLSCNFITTQLLAPLRGKGGISFLKHHKKEFLFIAEGPGYGSGCARRLFSCLSVQDPGCRSARGKLLFPPVPSAQTGWIATAAQRDSSLPSPSLLAL